MPRYWQWSARQDVPLTPFARMLALYQKRNGFYSNKEFAEHLGVHRNTLASWFTKGYLPERETLMQIYSKLEDVPAEEFWAAVGLEAPPRPREFAAAAHDANTTADERAQDWQRELDRFEQDVWRIQNDPRLSPEGRQAALDLLRVLRAGGRPVERRILAEHVVESVRAEHGVNEPLSSVLPPAPAPAPAPSPSAPPSPSPSPSRAPTEPLPERDQVTR